MSVQGSLPTLSTTLWIFTRVVKEVKSTIFFKASTKKICLQLTTDVLTLFQSLGWVVNQEKSDIIYLQRFDLKGTSLDLVTSAGFPTHDNLSMIEVKFNRII